jgi:hypothetical protein
VDIWIAVIGLVGVLGAAALGRWPIPSADARRRQSVVDDVALLKELPAESAARAEWSEHVDARLRELIETRKGAPDLTAFGLGVLALLVGGWLVSLAGLALQGSTEWVSSIATMLVVIGTSAVVAGSAVAAIVWSVTAVRACQRAWQWFKARRAAAPA